MSAFNDKYSRVSLILGAPSLFHPSPQQYHVLTTHNMKFLLFSTTLLEKEKMLVTSIFSCYHNVFFFFFYLFYFILYIPEMYSLTSPISSLSIVIHFILEKFTICCLQNERTLFQTIQLMFVLIKSLADDTLNLVSIDWICP